MLPGNSPFGVSQFQELVPPKMPLEGLPGLPIPRGNTSSVTAALGGGGSTASSFSQNGLLLASCGASLCSIVGDEGGTEEEEELSRDLLLEFADLACGGAGGDAQHPRACGGGGGAGSQRGGAASQRSSHHPSLQSSQYSGSTAADLEDSEVAAPVAAAAVAGGEDPAQPQGLQGDAAQQGLEGGEEEPLPSLYEQVGGGVAVKVLVDDFYRRVLSDPILSRFFVGVDMSKHTSKFLLFVTYVLGGPDEYLQRHPEPWPQLYSVHERLIKKAGLSEVHFDRVKGHFRDACLALPVGEVQISQALSIVESTRRIMFPLQHPTRQQQQTRLTGMQPQQQKTADVQQQQQQQQQQCCPFSGGAAGTTGGAATAAKAAAASAEPLPPPPQQQQCPVAHAQQ